MTLRVGKKDILLKPNKWYGVDNKSVKEITDKNRIAKLEGKIDLSLGDIAKVKPDAYAKKFIGMIVKTVYEWENEKKLGKNINLNTDLTAIINKIYEDGYEDGANTEQEIYEQALKDGSGLKSVKR